MGKDFQKQLSELHDFLLTHKLYMGSNYHKPKITNRRDQKSDWGQTVFDHAQTLKYV